MSKRYGLEIRRPTATDAATLADLLASVGKPISAVDLASRLEDMRNGTGAVLIAVEWGPPSGVIGLHWHYALTAARPIAEIDVLLVDPQARRRGIGRLLVKAAAQIARQADCDVLRLLVEQDQRELAAFAWATGFAGQAALFDRPLRKSGRVETADL